VEHTTFIHEPRKLPVVLSPEEVARLLNAAPGLKYKAALSVALRRGPARRRGDLTACGAVIMGPASENLQMIGHDISVLKRLSEA
jgi:hypothetical protein